MTAVTRTCLVVRMVMMAVVCAWPLAASAQVDRDDELLARAGRYVEDFVDRFSNVVAEERYVQAVRFNTVRPGRRARELVSDLLLVRAQGTNEWYQFRDVRVVDGEPVGDSQQRLARLFLQPWETALQQALAIVQEGTRYNLVNIGTLNYPLVALAFFQDHYRSQFEFSVGRPDPDLGSDVRVVSFREREREVLNAVITSVQSSGRAWVEETTGRIVRTDLRLRSREPRRSIQIVTDFADDERLGVAVPIAMHETYALQRSDMTGEATYGRFRTFQVQTDETLSPR